MWPKFRYDLHNSGAVTVTLDLTNPGALFSHRFSTGAVSAALRASPAVGADGTLYQVDDLGRLNAVASDGSVRWTSAAVLGTFNVSTGAFFDLGSSPAIGPGGSIYVGSESGGIYRFTPADGSNSQVFGSGTYQGGSVVIGPDGSLYAGSLDGTIYAVRADGTQRYATVAPCTPPYSPVVQSTPALDKNGVLYIGYGCTGGTNLQGGVVALSPTGTQLWKYTYSNPQQPGVTSGQIAVPVLLAPDEGTVYAVDFSQAGVYAINARDGTQRWATSLGGTLQGGGALSPDGSLLYLAVGDGTSFVGGLYAFRTADGSIATSQAEGHAGYASPAVDGAGQVIAAYGDGHVVGYSPGLGSVLFDRVAAGEGQAIFGGPVISTGGAFYITNNKGYLIALKANIFQAVPTVAPTTAPPPTGVEATLTPQAIIGLGTTTGTPATATGTPATGTPTFTAKGTPTRTPTAKPGAKGTPTRTPTPSKLTPGALTPTPAAIIGGPGGTPTATVAVIKTKGGSKGTGVGVIKVGSGRSPQAQPTARPVTGNGFRLTFTNATLARAALLRVRVQTTPHAHISYVAQISYVLATPTPKPKLTGKTKTKPKTTTKARTSGKAKPKTTPTPKPHTSGLSVAPLVVAEDQSGAAKPKPTATPRPKTTTRAKPTSTPKPTVKTKTPTKPAAPACPGGIATTVGGNGTYRFARTADAHGLDQYCLRLGAVPANATELRLTYTVQVTVGKKVYKGTKAGPYRVMRQIAAPAVARVVTPALAGKVNAVAAQGVIAPNASQTIKTRSAPGAQVVYHVVFPADSGGMALTIKHVADHTGADAATFRVGYLPPRQPGRATITVRVDATRGKSVTHGTVTFTVQRRDAVTAAAAGLRLTVGTLTVHPDDTQKLSVVAAPHAALSYTVAYGSDSMATFRGTADAKGRATLSFRVGYLPAAGARVAATITMTAVAHGARSTASGRFYVQG